MKYTDDFREKALKLAEEIGVKKASKELHVGEQTLYSWRKKAKPESINADPVIGTKENNIEGELRLDLKQELEEQKKLNQSCQQTIKYLVEENTALRQQCENYLMAITLISQR